MMDASTPDFVYTGLGFLLWQWMTYHYELHNLSKKNN